MHKPIAIVGISAEFPSGPYATSNLDHRAFFEFLLHKSESYEKIPQERFNIDSWKGRTAGRVITDHGSFLKDVALFDHTEFGVTFKDARSMALSTRKLIEHSFLALLDSGIDYRGRNVGCYMSGVSLDPTTIADADEFEARGSFAGYPYMIANKVSYHLDLTGPSIPTDTACSSSLSSFHLAIQALRTGDCESTLVGGSQLNQRLIDFIQYSQGSVLSPDGKCKPFDAAADGFARGEGVCVIVLKLLEDAVRDGDFIYASVLGTGINSTGSAAPVSAPVAEAQADAMLRAYRGTGRRPSEVDFIELHATGTAAGDPTEANWVGEKFKRDGELLIGSVKGNIGHLEITAFLASLSKVCSMLQTGLIPPNVNLRQPNPAILWSHYRMRVPLEVTKLVAQSESGRPLISITSSGIGGVNGHAVIEGPPVPMKKTVIDYESQVPIIFLSGGLSPRSALQVAADLSDLVGAEEHDKASIASIYGRRSRQMTWRSYTIWKAGIHKLEFPRPRLVPRSRQPLVFVFSGQGPQHIEMGRQLYAVYPTFRESIDRMDKVHEAMTGYSLIKHLGIFSSVRADLSLPEIWPIKFTLPALAMVQMALFDLLGHFGINPDIVIGHSAGETPLIYASGAASQEMAIEIAIVRGQSMSLVEDIGGSMAALNCSVDNARLLLKELVQTCPEAVLEIACFNSNDSVTLSGSKALIDQAVKFANSRGFMARKLRTGVPVHSSLMDGCRSAYVKAIDEVFSRYPGLHRPEVTTYSCTTGDKWDDPFLPEYYWYNARRPVMFSPAITSILQAHPTATFIEIGPHPVLSSYLTSLGANPEATLCPMRRSKNGQPFHEIQTLLDITGQLSMLGYNNLNFTAINHCDHLDNAIQLPSYPFSRKFVPFYPESSITVMRQQKTRFGPLNDVNLRIGSLTHPDLREHAITNEAIMPAAGYLEMAFEFGARLLWNVEFKNVMPIFSEKLLHVEVATDGNYWSVKSTPTNRQYVSTTQSPRLHAAGYLSLDSCRDSFESLDLDAIRARCRNFNSQEFYKTLSYFAQYGPKFQRVTSCYLGEREALVEIRGFSEDIPDAHEYVIHPAILDACFHIMVHPALTASADRGSYYLPSKIKTVVLHSTDQSLMSSSVYSHVLFRKWEPDNIEFDVAITDSRGSRICTLLGFYVARHHIDHTAFKPTSRYDMIYQQYSKQPLIERGRTCPNDILKDEILPSESLAGSVPLVFSFSLKDALDLQRTISKISTTGERCIWVEATLDGEGFAARGFTRSLRKETFSVEIRLVIFDQIWENAARSEIICQLSQVPDLEYEVFIDRNGFVQVPRLVPALTSSAPVKFIPSHRWTQRADGHIISFIPSQLSPEFVLVRIISLSPPEGGLRGFSGMIEDPGTSEWVKETCVFGIYDGPLSNCAMIHQGQVAPVGNLNDAQLYADAALSLLVASLSLGAECFHDVKRLRGRHIALTEGGAIFTQLHRILSDWGLGPVVIPRSPSVHALSLISGADIILSGYTNDRDINFVKGAMRKEVASFFWNSSEGGVRQRILLNPWFVGDTLRRVAHSIPGSNSTVLPGARIPEEFLGESHVYLDNHIFDCRKAYLLVGGIGSLGLQVALWMYEKGARNIILTSRSGFLSLKNAGNVLGTRILHYLESLPDLSIRLECCDASSESATAALLRTISTPLGGCILMSVVLADRLFISHTPESFYTPFTSKQLAFQTLERAMDIRSLDFFVTLSSAAIFGNIGQTNYASANTLVDGFLEKYPNAFSLVAPAISDSTTISHNENLTPDVRYQDWMPWAMTSRQLCSHLEDGIRALHHHQFGLYVPDFDWNKVQKHMGNSLIYDHLVKDKPTYQVAATTPDNAFSLQHLVLDFLDVDPNDFSFDVPFTSYGLDSLSAGRLSHALSPYFKITQLQLLADMSFHDLEKCQEAELAVETIKDVQVLKRFDWSSLNQPGETIVKLVDMEGIPLIMIHGASGNIIAFMSLQERFKSPLWAIQMTPETPLNSLEDMAAFYFLKIKEARPSGPYRLGSFSASSLLSYEVARLLEANGDQIVQMVQMDHFPALFASPIFTLDEDTLRTRLASQALLNLAFDSMFDCYKREPSAARRQLALELARAHKGLEVRSFIKDYYHKFERMFSMAVQFLLQLSDTENVTHLDQAAVKHCLHNWIRKVKAPVTLVIATRGIGPCIKEPGWSDLGAGQFYNVKTAVFENGHFDQFEDDAVIELLEKGW